MSNGTKGKKVPLQVIASLKSIRNFSVFFASLYGVFAIFFIANSSLSDTFPWLLLHLFMSSSFTYIAINIQYQIDGKNKVTLALPTFAFILSLYTVVSIVGIFIAHHLYKERRIISYFINNEKDKLMSNSQWSKSHPTQWSDAKSISLPIILGIILSSLIILYAFSKENDTLVEDQKIPTAYELVEYAKREISLPYTLEDSNIVIKNIVSETGNDVTYVYEVPDLSVSDIDKDEALNGFCSEEDSYWREAQKYNIQIIYKYIYEDGEIAIEPNENNCQ